MNVPLLPEAHVSPRQIAQVSHLLAAANHRQWICWERWVLRDPALLANADTSDVTGQASSEGLDSDLTRSAEAVIDIVRRIVGSFAYPPDVQTVIQRKRSQFAGWVAYAASQHQHKRERWLLQCRTPFLALPPAMQASDYDEARQDLIAIAEAGGLVLDHPLPEFTPQTPRHLRRLRRRHALGMHGFYTDSEQSWSNICTGCHCRWGVSY